MSAFVTGIRIAYTRRASLLRVEKAVKLRVSARVSKP